MQVIDQINGSALFAQSAYSASIATKDNLGQDITATYITGVNLPESASWSETTDVVQTNSGNWQDITAYQNASAGYLTAHQDLSPYYTTADANTLSGMLSGAIDYVSANAGDEFPASANEAITAYQNASGTYLTAIDIPESATWNDTSDVVQTNSGSWSFIPTYEYTDNNLISAIDTSGLYATSAGTANHLRSNGTMGNAISYYDGNNQMLLNPYKTPFGTTSGIYGPLKYATGAVITYGSSSDSAQYFGGFLKGNEWYISNATAGQALRGEVHASRGVHLSGATTAGYGFDLSIKAVSGLNSTGSWKYGVQEDRALRTVSALEYNAVDEISGIAGSAIAQYGAEKQWLQHDDTIVHVANSAQYALGVNLSALQRLMGIDQTLLYSGTATNNGNLNESIENFDTIKVNYVTDDGMQGVTEFMPSYTKAISLNSMYVAQNSAVWFKATNYTFSANTSFSSYPYQLFKANNGLTAAWSNNTANSNFRITRVIGIGRKS